MAPPFAVGTGGRRSRWFLVVAAVLMAVQVGAVTWFYHAKEARREAQQQQQQKRQEEAVAGRRSGGTHLGEQHQQQQQQQGEQEHDDTSLQHDTDSRSAIPEPHAKSVLVGGKDMATVGFGTAALGENTKEAVRAALRAGYTHFDTAMAREWYREDLVGDALRESGVDRDTLFITTKLHPKHLGTATSEKQIAESLERLHTSYINLLLIHYPHCFGSLCKSKPEGTWQDTWRVMEKYVEEGRVLAIGVSNFDTHELAELVQFARIQPQVVQLHSDPLAPNLEVQRFCKEHEIHFEAYSSLGTQHLMRTGKNPVMSSPVVLRLADKYHVSAGVIVLSWALHHNQIVIPRSRNEEHMRQNLKAVELVLLDSEYSDIDRMNPRSA